MAWDYANGESFYASPERVGYWRLAIMAWVAALLWALVYPSLGSSYEPALLEHYFGHKDLPIYLVQLVLFLFFFSWGWVKLLVLTAVVGEMLAAAAQVVLQMMAARPFLIVSQIGVSGLTGWGRQNVPWWQVTGIHIKNGTGPDGNARQLVISTSALAVPEGWRAWLMPKPEDGDRVAFVTPVRESAQLPQIIQQIRHYAPNHLRAIAEPAAA